MIRPDDEEKPFIARWNMLARILLVESSVKHIARAAMDYADFDDGSNCRPSNERLARETGYNERTVRFAWSALRGLGMAERVSRGTSYLRQADEYWLQIPEHWANFPILGPHGRKFTCLGCGKLFNPVGNCSVNELPTDAPGADMVRYDIAKMCFCPAPRKTKGRDDASCLAGWNQAQRKAGSPLWNQLGLERWKLFRQARADDW
ncbi:hypothetical protein [Paractinoplanes toevensis]|uniref:Uncharacterized protein n=1 Tax=Paractinoplanes toevensis TaxID=571911 RepID=A0A919T6R3_9ACTN|nr:hypothetical protein [Actinoplanes toevensis]GIM88769.1 hypothetical protein Ato02nite_005620 [Actinoplanes toevensis]